MTVTTTQINSDRCVVNLDNASATYTDISGTVTKISIEPSRDSKETYVVGDDDAIVTVGKSTHKFTLESIFSSATAEEKALLMAWFYSATDSVKRGSRSLRVDIPDSSSGSDRWSCEVKLAKPPQIEIDASKPEPLILKYELASDGPVSWTVIA